LNVLPFLARLQFSFVSLAIFSFSFIYYPGRCAGSEESSQKSSRVVNSQFSVDCFECVDLPELKSCYALPGANGLKLTKKIKTDHRQIVIVTITNYDILDYRQASYEYEAHYFFSKSSSPRQEK